jgi:hypothetical protein
MTYDEICGFIQQKLGVSLASPLKNMDVTSPTFAWAELCQGKCLAHPPLSPPHGDVMFMGYHGKSQFDVFFGGSAINLMGFHMIS